MEYLKFEKLINYLDNNFVSNAHTIQNRLFGFITTNIRSIGTIALYIKELVPVYLEYKNKNDLIGWNNYVRAHQYQHKQKIERLEIVRILFRNVIDNVGLNNNAEKLLEIADNYGIQYLELFLSFYLLSGKYFDIEKQPLVELEKIINIYEGDLLKDCVDCIINKRQNRIFFITCFFNTNYSDILQYLLNNNVDVDFLNNN